MKKLTTILFLLWSISLKAQLIAGNPVAGMSIYNANLTVTTSGFTTTDSLKVDLDADGIDDIDIILWQGAPPIDAPNILHFDILDTALTFCVGRNFPFMDNHAIFYNLNDTMNCGGTDTLWENNGICRMGSYGGFTAQGTPLKTNTYLAFQKNGQQRWLKMSYDITASAPSTTTFCTIHEILVPATLSNTTLPINDAWQIYPNPVQKGGTLFFEHPTLDQDALENITIYNSAGTIVQVETAATANYIRLQALPSGLYYLQLTTQQNQRWFRKFVVK